MNRAQMPCNMVRIWQGACLLNSLLWKKQAEGERTSGQHVGKQERSKHQPWKPKKIRLKARSFYGPRSHSSSVQMYRFPSIRTNHMGFFLLQEEKQMGMNLAEKGVFGEKVKPHLSLILLLCPHPTPHPSSDQTALKKTAQNRCCQDAWKRKQGEKECLKECS